MDSIDCNNLEWQPAVAAQAHSQVAGVLASIVFATLVLIATTRAADPSHPRRSSAARSRALILLSAAFLVLALDSFTFGVASGDDICQRAWTHTVFAASLLGLGTLGVFAGVSWLFEAYGHEDVFPTVFSVMIANVTALIVLFHLYATTISYFRDFELMGLVTVPEWLREAVKLYPYVLGALIVLFWPLRALVWAARRAPVESSSESHRDRPTAAMFAACLALACVVLISVASGLLVGRPRSGWQPVTPQWVVVWTVIIALAAPGLSVLAHVLALPGATGSGRRRAKTAPAQRPIDGNALSQEGI